MASSRRGSILKTSIFLVIITSIFTLYLYSNSFKTVMSRKLAHPKVKLKTFVSEEKRIQSMKKLEAIAWRNVDQKWLPADDICRNGVIFPSSLMTSTLVNYTLYFQNEKEKQTTVEYMNVTEAWGRRNFNSLFECSRNHTDAYFIDIDAGVGIYSIPMAHLGLQVVAVEYRYSLAERLCRGIVGNGLKGKAFIVNNVAHHLQKKHQLDEKFAGQRSMENVNVSSEMLTEVSSINLTSLSNKFPMDEAILRVELNKENFRVLIDKDFFERVRVHYVLMKWSDIVNVNGTIELIDFMTNHNFIPCLTPKCNVKYTKDKNAYWPMYVLWVQKSLVPQSALLRNMMFRLHTGEKKNTQN